MSTKKLTDAITEFTSFAVAVAVMELSMLVISSVGVPQSVDKDVVPSTTSSIKKLGSVKAVPAMRS